MQNDIFLRHRAFVGQCPFHSGCAKERFLIIWVFTLSYQSHIKFDDARKTGYHLRFCLACMYAEFASKIFYHVKQLNKFLAIQLFYDRIYSQAIYIH